MKKIKLKSCTLKIKNWWDIVNKKDISGKRDFDYLLQVNWNYETSNNNLTNIFTSFFDHQSEDTLQIPDINLNTQTKFINDSVHLFFSTRMY